MMKKLLFLGLAFSASVGVSSAQKARLLPSDPAHKLSAETVLNGEVYLPLNQSTSKGPKASNQKINARASFGTKIGKSFYDLPSNSAVANRTLRHADGSISAVWTETCTGNQSPSFTTRGIGYNYFNGGTWVEGASANPNNPEFNGTCGYPTAQANYGIASKRVGWPEIISIGGNEMVFTHDVGISVTQRPNKGTAMADWSTTTDLAFTKNIDGISGNNGTWPRVVTSGNTIHMLYTINNTPVPEIDGVSGIMVYSRSTDGGATWDKQNVKLPDLNSTNGYTRIGGDSYAIHANGNNVAIVSGGNFYGPWTMWKSADNGNTFTRTVLQNTLVPLDTVLSAGDTLTRASTVDHAHAVVVDNNGNAHAFAGELIISVKDSIGSLWPGQYWFPPTSNGLYYWSDKTPNMEPTIIATIEAPRPGGPKWIAHSSANARPYGILGMVSLPNAAYDAAGNIYLVYNSVVRGTSSITNDSTSQPYRDLYFMKMDGTNNTWGQSFNIGREVSTDPSKSSPAENGEENVYASVHHFVETDGLLHMTWMSDYEPGMSLGADEDPERENSIMYVAVNTNNVRLTGVKKDIAAFVNDIKAYPNPTNGKVAINVDLKKAADVKVRITNIMGQEISTVDAGKLATGKNTVSVDMSNLASGIYLYTVSSNDFTVTNRIVKQ